MKILITSGGTKIPIDSVRHIANMSKGTFGSKIAAQALLGGHKVIFLAAKNSKTPYTYTVNMLADNNPSLAQAAILNEFSNNYDLHTYETYDDYAFVLEKLIKKEKPDAVVLAAAVSDYGCKQMNGKIRSKDDLIIELFALPKIISKIHEWCPTTKLVGFKLLVGSTKQELIEAAKKSYEQNHCAFVVANDLRDIKQGKHKLQIVDTEVREYQTDPKDPEYLARCVVKEIEKL